MKKAFTLVEILVTIAVIGTISATIVPTLSHYLPGIQLNGDAKVLSSTLREAQEKTITEQKNYLVHFYPTSAPYYEICYLVAKTETSCRRETLRGSESMTILDNNNQTITDNFGPPFPASPINNRIVFSPDGGPSSAANITLMLNSNSKIINISPAGFINITN